VREQPSSDESRSSEVRVPPAVFGVVALALIVRLVQLSSAMGSPLTYQPGPDEDYYRRFGEAVAAAQGGAYSPEFTFMDPAYGYILGALFKLVGPNLFVVYILQVLLDTATACGILTIGRLLGRPRAGLLGALVYGLTSTAVMFCTTLLKEVWVTAFLTWWVVGALTLIKSERKWAWLLFGVYCGLGVGLRSTLIVLGLTALLLPMLGGRSTPAGVGVAGAVGTGGSVSPVAANRALPVLLTFIGIGVGLLPWSLRNDHAYGSLSPLPHNGGIVLQQIYNAQNPRAELWLAPFVSYMHPSEIWRGYAAEAERRAGGRTLSPQEVDHYWHEEAMTFIEQHPGDVFGDIVRKGLTGWLSSTELANNRSDIEEKMFSPVLAWLPTPAAWLLGMGLAGLIWLALEDRRWLIVAAPIALSWFTIAVFFAESRFRFHAASMLALCSGIWIDRLLQGFRKKAKTHVTAFAIAAAVIVTVSLLLGARNPPMPVRWDRIVWGYINMHKIAEAQSLAERVAKEQPDNGPIFEALGYTAVIHHRYDVAAQAFQRAVELRPQSHVAHYNLARAYLALGDHKRAAEEAAVAARLYPSPDYQALLSQLQTGS